MDRCLREFRIRGVKTNIPFLVNVVNHERFQAGGVTTSFLAETPELFQFACAERSRDQALSYLGEVIVNGNPEVAGKPRPHSIRPLRFPRTFRASRRRHAATARKLGPEKFAEWTQIAESASDHGHDIPRRAPVAHGHARSHLRFAGNLELRRAQASQPIQPGNVGRRDVRRGHAVSSRRSVDAARASAGGDSEHLFPDAFAGVQRGRLFGLSGQRGRGVHSGVGAGHRYFPRFRFAELAAQHEASDRADSRKTNKVCEAAICYTGDLLDPKRDKYPLQYYIRLAKELEKMGAHISVHQGHGRIVQTVRGARLFTALREEVGLPIHFHTHDTSGVNAASILKAAEAGVHAADAAIASMSGTTSQPNLNSMVAALQHTERDTGLDLDALNACADYWETVRTWYRPFDNAPPAGTAEVYIHEMPGGQYTNLREQAESMGLGARWQESRTPTRK
jgi:pyruvate carboxylase